MRLNVHRFDDDSVQLKRAEKDVKVSYASNRSVADFTRLLGSTRHGISNTMVPTQDVLKSDEVIVERRNMVSRSGGQGCQLTVQEVESC